MVGQTFFQKSTEVGKKRLTCTVKASKLAATLGRISANSIRVHIRKGNIMSLRQRKAFTAIAVFLAVSFAQVYVQTSFAEPGAGRGPVPVPQALVAKLTTRGGAATVNGASSVSGATILTGSTIETPDQVSATLDLGPLGTIDLSPNSSIQLDFTADGSVRVKVLKGCVRIKKKGAGEAEVYTAEGASEKTNSNRKAMGFCYLDGKLNPFGAAGGGGAAGAGLSTAAKVAIFGGIAGGTIGIILGTRGGNPSP